MRKSKEMSKTKCKPVALSGHDGNQKEKEEILKLLIMFFLKLSGENTGIHFIIFL